MDSIRTAAESELPHAYRVDERIRRGANFFLAALGGLIPCLAVLHRTRVLLMRGSLGSALLGEIVLLAAIVLPLGSRNNKRVVLREDSIEVIGWFYSRKLRFSEIRGRHTTASSRRPYGYAYVFLPIDRTKRNLALPLHLHTDEFFRNWLKTIPAIPHGQ